MTNKLAKLKYLPNTFEVVEKGDHVICAVSNKKILLENLNYWKSAPVWTPKKIAIATKDWFKYLK